MEARAAAESRSHGPNTQKLLQSFADACAGFLQLLGQASNLILELGKLFPGDVNRVHRFVSRAIG